MKSNKLSIVLKSIFFVCCCFITTKAEAVCQAETCGQHHSHTPRCGDGDCTPFVNPNFPNYAPENHGNCPQDCSSTATCGDGVISLGEDCNNCPADVPICSSGCGDRVCSSSLGETCLTCARDCGTCGTCGNGICNCAPNGTETVANCPQDCGVPSTTTTTTIPICRWTCGDGVCAEFVCLGTGCPCAENFNNCPQDCHCPRGQVERGGAKAGQCCPAGIPRARNNPAECCPTAIPFVHQVAPGVLVCTASVCPPGQVERGVPRAGQCCPAGIPRALNNPAECCPAATPYAQFGPNDELVCTASICPAGQVERGVPRAGQCCPAGIPRALNNPAECCPAATPYASQGPTDALICSACPPGQVERRGGETGGSTTRGKCCPPGIPLALNNPAECCPAAIPYVQAIPGTIDSLMCTASICPLGQVERGVPRAGQCCPAGIPRALNNPAECCPAATPYAHFGPTDALICTASVCPAGQVERGGAKAGQCCPAGIPRAANNPAECCPAATPYVFPDGHGGLVCKAQPQCNLISFSTINSYSANFQYNTTTGTGASCLDTIIRDSVAGMTNSGKSSFSVISQSAGNFHLTGRKWADDTLVRGIWTKLLANTSLVNTNYTPNKQYINCSGGYVDTSGDGNTSGFGEGVPGQASCNRGSLVLDANCKLVKTADITAICGSTYLGRSTISWYTSTPISLILDEQYDLHGNVSVVKFALDPSLAKSYWLWKASEKSPLLVYDPLHRGDVTSATQLFGNWTFGGQKVASLFESNTPHPWNNGFEALKTLDNNNDGEISGTELKPLALWLDKNQDGISQAGEVKEITSFGIKSLSVVADKIDSVNKTIEATKGFVRVDNGKTSSGRLVDWSSEGSEVSALLISAQLLNKENLTRSVPNTQEDKQLKNIIKSSNTESDNSYGKNEGRVSAAAGVWRWKLEGEVDVNVKSGYFSIADNGSEIAGHTIMELPMSIGSGNTENRNYIINFAKLSGTQEPNADGGVTLKFNTLTENGIIKNEAKIASAGGSMKGSSDAEFEEAGTKKHLRYSWTAEKVGK